MEKARVAATRALMEIEDLAAHVTDRTTAQPEAKPR